MSARAEAAAATGERLLEAAWKHFGTLAYEEVRLREIAADAGVTEQTLLARFHSKDALLAAAYRWWGRREISRRDTAPVGRFPEAVTNVFDHYEAHGTAILRMLSQEDRIPAVREMTDRGRDYHRDWVSRVFQPVLSGLPPALFIVGDKDPLQDDSLRMHAKWLAQSGNSELIVVPEAPHGFNHLPTTTAAKTNAYIRTWLAERF